jgi:hypothetical protein
VASAAGAVRVSPLQHVIRRDSGEEHEEIRSEAMTTANEQQRPDRKGRMVAVLADDDSSYSIGQIWAVCGGLDM